MSKLHIALGFDPVVRNCNRILRVPGSVNWKNGKDGRVPSPSNALTITGAISKLEDVRKALADIVEPAKTPKVNYKAVIQIDWAKVKSPGWLKSAADLPADAPRKLKIILDHTGTLAALTDDLMAAELLNKPYRSWSEVTFALAAAFKQWGKYGVEEIAEALMADLLCNRHITNNPDPHRAVERAINRSHERVLGLPGHPAINFRDFTEKGKARASLANAVIAIKALGIEIRLDLFHHRIIVEHSGTISTVQEGILTDDTNDAIRSLINNTYRLDCKEYVLPAVKEIARDHAFDPVLDYLAECQGKWDGKKRIDTWVIHYLGCEDTPLNRAIGRLMLLGSVRRVHEPGCKFDPICVLEGPEGVNKSTVIRVLASDENFSDQSVLNVSDREAQEQLEGVWLHESADLTGLKKAEVERVKAFASRQVDRARPAYSRVREDRKRRNTQWATTNDDAYLASQTGNRRFWPLPVGSIDIEALRRDRDQLWGEAATLDAKGASIVLDPALWPAAAEEQEKRRVHDTWEDVIENMPPAVDVRDVYSTNEVQIIYQSDGKELVRSADLLEHVLGVQTGHQHSDHGRRLARVMKRCGWQAGRFYILGKQERGYCRDAPAAEAPEEWREWLKEKPVDGNYGDNCFGRSRKVEGKVVAFKKAKTGFWYALRGGELLGRAGCPQRFSTSAEACAAVDRLAGGDVGWQWIAWPDRTN